MKKTYFEIEIDVISFAAEDVIRTSGGFAGEEDDFSTAEPTIFYENE